MAVGVSLLVVFVCCFVIFLDRNFKLLNAKSNMGI